MRAYVVVQRLSVRPSVRLGVCHSVTFVYSVETNKHTGVFNFFTVVSHTILDCR